MNVEEKSEFATPFEWIGGEARVHALVERFYPVWRKTPNLQVGDISQVVR